MPGGADFLGGPGSRLGPTIRKRVEKARMKMFPTTAKEKRLAAQQAEQGVARSMGRMVGELIISKLTGQDRGASSGFDGTSEGFQRPALMNPDAMRQQQRTGLEAKRRQRRGF